MKKYFITDFRYLMSFLLTTSVLVSAVIVGFKYYFDFLDETAGSYSIATVFGEPLRNLILKILFFVAGLIILAFSMIKSSGKLNNKCLHSIFLSVAGLLWIILPLLSSYTISRFTGLLICQTVVSIAVISNVVFMMLSACFGMIALVDLALDIVELNKTDASNCVLMILCGAVLGSSFVLLIAPIVQQTGGIKTLFLIIGILLLISGPVCKIFKPYKA